MRARRGLIPSSFLVLLLPLILVSCGGGGSDPPSLAPDAVPPVVGPPAPAGLIWSTPTGIFRSQTDGSSLITLANAPDLRQVVPDLEQSVVIYKTRPDTATTAGTPNLIWKADVQGGGTQQLVETGLNTEFIMDVIGSWVIYGVPLRSWSPHSVALDGSVIHSFALQPALFYQLSVGGRAVFVQNENIPTDLYSLLPDATDLRHLTVLPVDTLFTTQGVVGNQVIYSLESFPPASIKDLFAVPVTGGPVTTLANSPDYEWLGAVVGSRVIYHRCVVEASLHVGQCDLSSVLSDGTGTVALSTNPDNEIVQGVIGSQVIVRRNSGATDSLYSIPASGGAEVPMLTLADPMHEFVAGIVGDRVILKQSTGLWSLRADGSGFVHLTTEADGFMIGGAGPFACFNRGPALWCVPADGSGPATKVTENGTFVTGL
jgi:hypothetical protein